MCLTILQLPRYRDEVAKVSISTKVHRTYIASDHAKRNLTSYQNKPVSLLATGAYQSLNFCCSIKVLQ